MDFRFGVLPNIVLMPPPEGEMSLGRSRTQLAVTATLLSPLKYSVEVRPRIEVFEPENIVGGFSVDSNLSKGLR